MRGGASAQGVCAGGNEQDTTISADVGLRRLVG